MGADSIRNKLKNRKYKDASDDYLSLSINESKRRNYFTVSVKILLGFLSLLKITKNISKLELYISSFMEKIGFSSNVIRETHSLKLMKDLLIAIGNRDKKSFQILWEQLEDYREFLFKEEYVLLEMPEDIFMD